MEKDLQFILRTQLVTGRTQNGREIGVKMKDPIRASLSMAERPSEGFQECINCGFVVLDEYFADGCPNCGCKDVRGFGDKEVATEES